MTDLADVLLQHADVLTRAQALAFGCTDGRIQAQLRAGRWQLVHPRVYCTTTGQLTRTQQLWAALLYAGDGAALSHWTAAELHGLAGRVENVVHVTIPADRRIVGTAGLRLHRSRSLDDSQVQGGQLLRRTRVERTVLDLLQTVRTVDQAFALVADACQRRLTTPQRLNAALAARAKTRWRAAVGPALEEIAAGSHSLLEHRFVVLNRRHGLPHSQRQLQQRNDRVNRWLDCDYTPLPVRVELDGRLGHERGLERWRDMGRDNAATLDGQTVLRYGWDDVTGRPCAVAGQVAAALVLRGWNGRHRVCGAQCEL